MKTTLGLRIAYARVLADNNSIKNAETKTAAAEEDEEKNRERNYTPNAVTM